MRRLLLAVLTLGVLCVASSVTFMLVNAGSAATTFETSRCASGLSSGGMADYGEGGGEPSAAAATRIMAGLVRRQQEAPLRAHTVRMTDDEVVTQFVDGTGNIVGQGSVVRDGERWQLGALEQCAPAKDLPRK